MSVTEAIIQAASKLITNAVEELIYKDPHQWSERSCQTCNAISALIGKDFGCKRCRKEREAARAAERGGE